MLETFRILWAFYLSILLLLAARYFYKPLKQTPPKSTRIAAVIEACCGTFLVLLSIPVKFDSLFDVMLKLSFHVIGLLWFLISIQLYKGNSFAKNCCLIISIVRCFTIVGLPFSIISIMLLYFTETSKKYFAK